MYLIPLPGSPADAIRKRQAMRRAVRESDERLRDLERRRERCQVSGRMLAEAQADHAALVKRLRAAERGMHRQVPANPLGLGR